MHILDISAEDAEAVAAENQRSNSSPFSASGIPSQSEIQATPKQTRNAINTGFWSGPAQGEEGWVTPLAKSSSRAGLKTGFMAGPLGVWLWLFYFR